MRWFGTVLIMLIHANYTDSQLVTYPQKQNGQLVKRP